MKARRLVPVLLALAGSLALMPSVAQALSPPAPRAEVVFSNGGRIMAMNADGSDRRVLFGRNRDPKNDGAGAVDPVVSPDGENVAFAFKGNTRWAALTDIWAVGPGVPGSRKLFQSSEELRFGDPTFTPDGRLVVAYYRQGKRFVRTGLMSMSPLGGPTKRLFELKQKRRPYRSALTVTEPDFSPDGKKVLYVLNGSSGGNFTDEGFRNALIVRDLSTGKTRKVATGAYDGAWSGDGKRIAYTAQTDDDDRMLCWWEAGCDFGGQIAIVRADGSDRRMLTGKQLDERSPDWSADNRIVFQSARSIPDAGEATEIYSVRPDGKCLTMLTNGAPASLTPVWSGARFGSTTPSGCGDAPPGPNLEVTVPQKAGAGRLWLGEHPGTRLLTGSMAEGGATMVLYIDCDRQHRAGCDSPVGLWSVDVCAYRGVVAEAFGDGPPIRRQRGVPVFRSNGAEIGPFVYLFSGRSVAFFYGGSGKGSNLGKREVEELRRVGEERSDGDLPAVMLPASDIRLMNKIRASFGRTGSVPATARRTGIGRARVRANLKFSRQLKTLGDYGTVNCPRAKRPRR